MVLLRDSATQSTVYRTRIHAEHETASSGVALDQRRFFANPLALIILLDKHPSIELLNFDDDFAFGTLAQQKVITLLLLALSEFFAKNNLPSRHHPYPALQQLQPLGYHPQS